MPTFKSSLAALLFVLASVSATAADEFDFVFRANGKPMGEASLTIDKDAAEVKIGDEVEEFGLKAIVGTSPTGRAG